MAFPPWFVTIQRQTSQSQNDEETNRGAGYTQFIYPQLTLSRPLTEIAPWCQGYILGVRVKQLRCRKWQVAACKSGTTTGNINFTTSASNEAMFIHRVFH